jgi:hypothetical protein
VNGKAAVNSNSLNDETNENVMLIVDSLDVYGTDAGVLDGYESMNMISGYEVGNWLIGPGVLLNENFDITYGLGNLHIVPETLYVKARDTVTGSNGAQPVYSSDKYVYQYEDEDNSVIASGPSYTVLNSSNVNVGTGNLTTGSYQIVPSGVTLKGTTPDYIIVYKNGTLTVAPTLAVTAVEGAINCNGGTTTVTVSASGGTAPYTGTGVKTVYAGAYSFTVTDAAGISKTITGSISQPVAITSSVSAQTNVICYGAATGSATISAAGGSGTLTYSWSPSGGTGAGATGLTAGNYTVTITDTKGCTKTQPVTITQPTVALSVACTTSNNTLYFGYPGDQTTAITGKASGGTAPYTIKITMNRPIKCNYINDAGDEIWSATAGTTTNNSCPVYPNLAATAPVSTLTNVAENGSYAVTLTLMADADITITVTDKNGCVKSCTTKVYAEDVRCFAGNSGNAKVTICHKTGSTKNPCVKICVDQADVQEHINHGDFLGNCTPNCVAPVTAARAAAIATEPQGDGPLSLKVIPNPSSTYFSLVLRSLSKEKINLKVMDVAGRVIEQRSDVKANSTLQLGSRYYSGMYFAEITQGSDKVIVRLLKQR